MAANSASASEPQSVTNPTPIHTHRIGPNERSAPATSPTLRKIPEPMIEPTTTVTASNSPRTRGSSSHGGLPEDGKLSSEFIIASQLCADPPARVGNVAFVVRLRRAWQQKSYEFSHNWRPPALSVSLGFGVTGLRDRRVAGSV